MSAIYICDRCATNVFVPNTLELKCVRSPQYRSSHPSRKPIELDLCDRCFTEAVRRFHKEIANWQIVKRDLRLVRPA